MMWQADSEYSRQYGKPVAGVDEVGRGCVFGPVLAAAFLPGPRCHSIAVSDSKALAPRRRLKAYSELVTSDGVYSIGLASVAEIEKLNILGASKLAMLRALNALPVRPIHALIDGNARLETDLSHETIVAGDSKIGAIAAASIIAKVTRDFLMMRYALSFKGYAIERNMGYATREHLEALRRLGPTPVHRNSFGSVSQLRLQV